MISPTLRSSIVLSKAARVIRPLAATSRQRLRQNNFRLANMSSMSTGHGDLNNTSVLRRAVQEFRPEPEYAYRSLAIPESHDDLDIRTNYRPFLLRDDIESNDWISRSELSTAVKMASSEFERTGERLKMLVLYGSLRNRCVTKASPILSLSEADCSDRQVPTPNFFRTKQLASYGD